MKAVFIDLHVGHAKETRRKGGFFIYYFWGVLDFEIYFVKLCMAFI